MSWPDLIRPSHVLCNEADLALFNEVVAFLHAFVPSQLDKK